MPTIAEFIQANADSDATAIVFEDESWTWREYVAACNERAALAARTAPGRSVPRRRAAREHARVPHLARRRSAGGATAVGINPTRRGAELARDITPHRLPVDRDRGSPCAAARWTRPPASTPSASSTSTPPPTAMRSPRYAGARHSRRERDRGERYLLLFTSGTSGAPKAVICSPGKLWSRGQSLLGICGLTRDTVFYQAMPMFHSNAPLHWLRAALRRRHDGAAAEVLGLGLPRRRAQATAPPTSTTWASRSRTSWRPRATRRRRQPAALRLRQRSRGARHRALRGALRLRGDRRLRLDRGAPRISREPPTRRRASLGGAPEGVVVLDPETAKECPPAGSTRTAGC